MHVAYDLRFAADHFPGIGRHTICLLEALLEQPGPERYTLLWNPELKATRFDADALRRHPRVNWVERPISPLSPLSLWQVGGWLRAIRPDVYLSTFYYLPVGAGCPCVLTVHDVWPLRLGYGLSWWKRAAYRALLEHAARARLVLTVSAFSKREIEAVTSIRDVRAVQSGVPPVRRAAAPQRPARVPDRPFAFNVGLNFPYKNLETLVEAWALLGDAAPLDLVLAGREMPQYPSAAALARRRGVSRVTVLGHVSEAELEWLYANARLLVFPSTYEGFGFPLVEGFVHGLPVIAADIPALRELDDGAARFVPPRDPRAWADAVTALAHDDAALARMRERGLARVAELRYATTAGHVLQALREAAGRPATAEAAA